MRLLGHSLAAFVFALWTAATGSKTTDHNQTSDAALHSPIVPTRVKPTVVPGHLHASAAEMDDAQPITETRGSHILLEAIQAIAAKPSVFSAKSEGVLEKLEPHFYSIYLKWLEYTEGPHITSTNQVYGKNAVAEHAKFFEWLRADPNMKDLADAMHRNLFVQYGVDFELTTFERWASSKLNPRDAYQMMPISSAKRLEVGASWSDDEWSDYCVKFVDWLYYIDMYRAVAGREGFTDADILRLLTNNDKQVARELVTRFQNDPDTEPYGNRLFPALDDL